MSFNTLCVRLEDAHHTPADLGCVCLRHGSLTFELRQALTDVFSSWNPNLEKDNPQRLTALLTDSLPDLWGRKVANELLKARARKDEVRPAPVDDALLLGLVCDSDRMGALRFADVGNSLHFLGERRFAHPKASDLAELCQTARRIESGDILSAASLERFAENASALGGSRPKAGFADENGRLCLAKFPSINDDRDKGAWEYVTARLAQKPESVCRNFSSSTSTIPSAASLPPSALTEPTTEAASTISRYEHSWGPQTIAKPEATAISSHSLSPSVTTRRRKKKNCGAARFSNASFTTATTICATSGSC